MGWPTKADKGFTPNSKIRITRGLEGVWAEFQPQVGKTYDADFTPHKGRSCPAMAVIMIQGKPIVVRRNEFELVEDSCGI